MRPWVLAVPFAVACLAWGLRVAILATKAPIDGPNLECVAFHPSVWLPCVMLIQSVFLEWRHYGLPLRPARLWAYGLAVVSNAFLPTLMALGFVGEYLGVALLDPERGFGLVYLFVLLSSLVSWAIVAFLCVFKDRSISIPARLVPAGFAILGSAENCIIAFAALMSI